MSRPLDRSPLLRRLSPEREALTAEQALGDLRLGHLAPADRPYVVVNMVASVDGRATLGGRAGPLGGEADRQVFHHLRAQADAVMAGARTVTVERYGRLVRDGGLRELRDRLGLALDPLAVLVSGRLDVPADLPLLQDEGSRVVIATGSPAELEGCRAQVEYLRGTDGGVDLGDVLGRLRAEHGVRSLLCEGGPTLNGALLREGLVDELFLTVAAKLAGGPDPLTIVAGPALGEVVGLELVWALEAAGELLLRYRVAARG